MNIREIIESGNFQELRLKNKGYDLDFTNDNIVGNNENEKQELHFDKRSSISLNMLFHDRYGLNINILFIELFDTLPFIHEINNINIEKSVEMFVRNYGNEIQNINYNSVFKKRKKKIEKRQQVFILSDKRVVEFSPEGCTVLTSQNQLSFAEELLCSLSRFKKKNNKSRQREINLITTGYEGFQLTEVDIKPVKLNLQYNYADDFLSVHDMIQKRLNNKNDKGIVLLHGLPGTGKTTYLRYLVARLRKKVMFLPPDIATNLTQPSFINLLIENPNSILVIEDAENIILDRKEGGNASISNLLNVSDGLLSDVLNMQIICSFNINISKVDSALLRKGRLIAKYEFDKLDVDKAQRLSESLGFNTLITEPMTLAEIYNQNEIGFEEKKRKIGFGK
jgi:hypothetical protein